MMYLSLQIPRRGLGVATPTRRRGFDGFSVKLRCSRAAGPIGIRYADKRFEVCTS